MPRDDELGAWVSLGLVPGLHSALWRALLSAFGLPSRILAAGHGAIAAIVGEPLAVEVRQGAARRIKAVDATLEWASHPGQHLVTLADEDYPRQLLEIPDPPPLLYLRGERRWLAARALAIVGSRNATAQGRSNAERFAQSLSDAGLTIVSGLALGIDAAAHRGGLAGRGSTIGVLGCGVDICYPPSNRTLYEAIAARGALISEYPLGAPPLPMNFPRRNRLISGLARGCLVVEAALGSGSLITARLAADQGRDVFAIPGSIHSPLARGCHALIKQGAKLVETARDVLDEAPVEPGTPELHHRLHPYDELLQHMGYDPCSIDALVARSGLTPEAVSAMLLHLELDERVNSLPGGLYQRLS